MNKLVLVLLSFTLTACLGMPDSVTPVRGFELDRYLGKWYEIARLVHSFERGLVNVSAQYSLREDGGVTVMNRGYSTEDREWKQAEGKAYFVGDANEGYLKVSFFGPFYGSYVVFELDRDNYQYAFIAGPNRDFLWLLARTPTVDPALIERFVAEAGRRGYDTDELIIVDQQVETASTAD